MVWSDKEMKEVILHIGGPKCASSSIQKYCKDHLSDLVENTNGKKYSYFRILKSDQELFAVNKKEDFPNANSSQNLYQFKGNVKSIFDKINDKTKNDVSVVLSCEEWAFDLITSNDLFNELKDLKLPIKIFFVVRPILSVLNSSWLQWGAFSGDSLENWIEKKILQSPNQFEFFQQYERISSLHNIREICICDISQNPVKVFQDFLEMPITPIQRENETTHIGLLYQIVRNQKIMGRTVHDSSIENFLNKQLNLPKCQTPFFIPKKLVDLCQENHGKNMRNMVNLLNKFMKLDEEVERLYFGTSSIFSNQRTWESGPSTDELLSLNDAWLMRTLKIRN